MGRKKKEVQFIPENELTPELVSELEIPMFSDEAEKLEEQEKQEQEKNEPDTEQPQEPNEPPEPEVPPIPEDITLAVLKKGVQLVVFAHTPLLKKVNKKPEDIKLTDDELKLLNFILGDNWMLKIMEYIKRYPLIGGIVYLEFCIMNHIFSAKKEEGKK